jgi:hypothetical protein
MLIEIISKYDFGDEIGRDRLKILMCKIMREIEVEESAIKIIIQIMEELLPQTETRLEVRKKMKIEFQVHMVPFIPRVNLKLTFISEIKFFCVNFYVSMSVYL